MPLCSTIGASAIIAFNRRPTTSPSLWYVDGALAQGTLYNLQGDGKYYTYNQGLNTGAYTGPWYSVNVDNLWRRIIYGQDAYNYLLAAGVSQPPNALVYVNGYFDLDGQGSKWYHNGVLANGYIQNLEQYATSLMDQVDIIYTPTSTLSYWHYFTYGTDDGLISGEHNADNQGNLWYVDGQLASSSGGFGLQITSDSLWHKFDAGVDLGLVNAGVDPNDTQGIIDYLGGSYFDPLLVFNGLPFTGKYFVENPTSSALFRLKIDSDPNIIQIASAFEFVDGVPVSILSGDHAPANMDKDANGQAMTVFWKDGAMMSNLIRYEGSEVVHYGLYLNNSRTVITGNEIYYGFFPSYENMLLPIDSPEPLFKHYLIINGAMTAAGCLEWVGQSLNQYYCLGNYGEVQGVASDLSCSDCVAQQDYYLS